MEFQANEIGLCFCLFVLIFDISVTTLDNEITRFLEKLRAFVEL